MGFIPVNLNEAKEPKPVPLGKYDLTILGADVGVTRVKKTPQFIVSIGIEGHHDAPPVNHYMNIHTETDEPDTQKFKTLILKRFLTLFGMKPKDDGYDPEQLAMEMQGRKARADLTIETEKDSEGNEKVDGRTFNRLQVPRLKDEVGMQTGATSAAPQTKAKR